MGTHKMGMFTQKIIDHGKGKIKNKNTETITPALTYPILKEMRKINITKTYKDQTCPLTSSNCCIIKKPNNEYILSLRFINYYIDLVKGYISTPEKKYISMNQIVSLDNTFRIKPTNQKLFLYPSKDMKEIDYYQENNKIKHLGVQDIKLFYHSASQSIKVICNVQTLSGTVRVLVGDYDDTRQQFHHLQLIECAFHYQPMEKNWVYFENENQELLVVYQWYPFQIGKIDENTKTLELVSEKIMPPFFQRARGSSCGILYKNEIWFLIHKKNKRIKHEKDFVYLHSFVVFDRNMNLKRYTEWFVIEGQSIEFCLGFCINEITKIHTNTDTGVDTQFILSYSVFDVSSKIGIYNKKTIDELPWNIL